jgi:hypothetical protein
MSDERIFQLSLIREGSAVYPFKGTVVKLPGNNRELTFLTYARI